MLARRGYSNIKVYDRLSEPEKADNDKIWNNFDTGSDRLYMIGLNGRGQKALKELNIFDRIQNYTTTIVGRIDWTPDTPINQPREILFTDKSYTTHVIQRDRLTSCILEEIKNKYQHQISLEFDVICTNAEWIHNNNGDEVCNLYFRRKLNDGTTENFIVLNNQFVLGCDGTGSKIRDAMEKSSQNKFFVKRYDDKNVRVYRTIPIFWPKDDKQKSYRNDVNYSIRTKSDINLDALPTKEGPYIGVVLYRPWDERLQKMQTAADAKAFFNEILPMFTPGIRESDYERFAQKKDSNLPTFSYSGPILHKGKTTCLLGDCIHSVKPYFGQGVNSAFEDVIVLNKALENSNDDIGKAVALYSKMRAKDAEALVHMSKRLDGGFFVFILPLILDSLFNRALPFLFSTNTISFLQNEKVRFRDIRLKKRIDRVMQFLVIGGTLSLITRAIFAFITGLKKFLI